MEYQNRYDGVPSRVVRNLRHHARRLARSGRLPGMDQADIEQELMLDLLQRQVHFDPARASFETFADRIINHRVASLMAPTARLRAERIMISIDVHLSADGDEDAETMGASIPEADGLYAEPYLPAEIRIGLARDVGRFLGSLSPVLRRYAGIFAADNVSAAARDAGLHRSTIYERMHQLRADAAVAGLQEYLGGIPTVHSARR